MTRCSSSVVTLGILWVSLLTHTHKLNGPTEAGVSVYRAVVMLPEHVNK